MISRDEWLYLLEYVAVMHQQTVAAARARKKLKPKSLVAPEMFALVPPDLIEQLASPQFADSCMASFDSLDVNRDEKLSKAELMPVIVEILGSVEGGGPPLSQEQCMIFVDKV